MDKDWIDIGEAAELASQSVRRCRAGNTEIALTCVNGLFGAVHNACNHVGGPLGEGTLQGDYLVCPWHQWRFNRITGLGEPGFENDHVPSHEVRVENGRLLVNLTPQTTRHKTPHDPHPLARPVRREPGPIRDHHRFLPARNGARRDLPVPPGHPPRPR